jgi:hypothetical protein
MNLKQKTRMLAGLAAVLTLLGLIAADTIHPQISLSLEDKVILVSLISALLGVDLALKELPIKLNLKGGQDDE